MRSAGYHEDFLLPIQSARPNDTGSTQECRFQFALRHCGFETPLRLPRSSRLIAKFGEAEKETRSALNQIDTAVSSAPCLRRGVFGSPNSQLIFWVSVQTDKETDLIEDWFNSLLISIKEWALA